MLSKWPLSQSLASLGHLPNLQPTWCLKTKKCWGSLGSCLCSFVPVSYYLECFHVRYKECLRPHVLGYEGSEQTIHSKTLKTVTAAWLFCYSGGWKFESLSHRCQIWMRSHWSSSSSASLLQDSDLRIDGFQPQMEHSQRQWWFHSLGHQTASLASSKPNSALGWASTDLTQRSQGIGENDQKKWWHHRGMLYSHFFKCQNDIAKASHTQIIT